MEIVSTLVAAYDETCMHNETYHVFYLDDDDDDQSFFVMSLAEARPHAICHAFFNCAVLLSYLHDETAPYPDLIFIDQHIQGNRKNECLKEIKNMARYKHLPVIIYTTGSTEDRKEKAIADGAYLYAIKSTHPSTTTADFISIFSNWENQVT